jgi:uncharacterized protein
VGEFLESVETERKESCAGCWAKLICAGGCYHEAFVRQGALAHPNRHYCDWIRNWVEIGMGVYGRLAISAPDYLDKLSALRGHTTLFGRYN